MLSIVHYPHPSLTQKTHLVTVFDNNLQNLTTDMIKTMHHHHGIGLAANQITSKYRIFVMHCNKDKDALIFINPVILEKTGNANEFEEGCLSFPGLIQPRTRAKEVKLKWQDVEGNFYTDTFHDLEAICIQHEIDHLDGITFLDNLSALKKQLIVKKYQKNKK